MREPDLRSRQFAILSLGLYLLLCCGCGVGRESRGPEMLHSLSEPTELLVRSYRDYMERWDESPTTISDLCEFCPNAEHAVRLPALSGREVVLLDVGTIWPNETDVRAVFIVWPRNGDLWADIIHSDATVTKRRVEKLQRK